MTFTTDKNIEDMTHQEVLDTRTRLTAHVLAIGHCPAELRELGAALDNRILLDLLDLLA